jgi:hypothetical protein
MTASVRRDPVAGDSGRRYSVTQGHALPSSVLQPGCFGAGQTEGPSRIGLVRLSAWWLSGARNAVLSHDVAAQGRLVTFDAEAL